MGVWGFKSKELIREKIPGTCPACGKQDTREMIISQNYFHFFLVPVLPFGKISSARCTACKGWAVSDSEMSSKQLEKILLKRAKTPVWTWSGIIFLAMVVALGAIFGSMDSARNKKLLQQPQKGDILEIKIAEDQYTLYRIDSTRGDSVFLRVANRRVTGPYPVEELKSLGDTLYTGQQLSYHKETLLEMAESGTITDVDRK